MSQLYKYDGTPFVISGAISDEAMSEEARKALVSCFQSVPWLDEYGIEAYRKLVLYLDVSGDFPIAKIRTFEIGTGFWTTNNEYITFSSQNVASSNLSTFDILANDIFTIDDYSRYKYKIGTNNDQSSTDGNAWITSDYLTEDYEIKNSDIQNAKVIVVRRIDDANLTANDISYLNTHVKVLRKIS